MSDLAFAALAAEDDNALQYIAQSGNTDGMKSNGGMDCSEIHHIDDLDIAASAAEAGLTSAPQNPPAVFPDRRQCSAMDIMMDEEDLLSDSDDDMESNTAEDIPEKVSVSFTFPDESSMLENTISVNLTVGNSPTGLDEEIPGNEEEMEVVVEAPEKETCQTVDFSGICLETTEDLKAVGVVQSEVDGKLVVASNTMIKPLETGTVLFCLEGEVVGKIVEIFGTIHAPFYLVEKCPNLDLTKQTPGTIVYNTDRLSFYVELESKEEEEEIDSDAVPEQFTFNTCTATQSRRRKRRPAQQQGSARMSRRDQRLTRTVPQEQGFTPVNVGAGDGLYPHHAGFHPYFPLVQNPVMFPGNIPQTYVVNPAPMMVYQPYGVILPPADGSSSGGWVMDSSSIPPSSGAP